METVIGVLIVVGIIALIVSRKKRAAGRTSDGEPKPPTPER